jgi:PAS domain S-box-containing protein
MPQDSTKFKAGSSDELINLNEAEEHLRAVSETSLDGLIITDQGGKIIFWNKAATEIFGHEPEEMMGKYVTGLMPDQGIEAYARARERVLGQGVSKFGTRPREMTAMRKDGTEIIIEAAMTHWKLRDRYYFGGTFHDVTEGEVGVTSSYVIYFSDT